MNLYARLYQAIMENDPIQKCLLTDELFDDWQNQRLTRVNDCPVESIDVPGRPVKPTLVNPRKVPKRSMITELGKCNKPCA
jgi:uncharacterized ferritin-like protein (DUF455 family)